MLNSCYLDNFVVVKNVKTYGDCFYFPANRQIITLTFRQITASARLLHTTGHSQIMF